MVKLVYTPRLGRGSLNGSGGSSPSTAIKIPLISPRLRLLMTVGAQESQVIEPVIVSNAVDMI